MNHLRLIVLAQLLALALVSGCGDYNLRRAIRDGEAALQDRNYEVALRHLSRAATRLPGDAALQYNIGMANFGLGSFTPAEEALQRTLALEPGNADATELLGHIALHRSQWKKARDCFNKVKQAVPEAAPRLLCALSNVERGAGNYDLARVRLLQALKADWKYAPAHYNLAMLYSDHFAMAQSAIDELELFSRMVRSDDPQLAKALKTLQSLKQLRSQSAQPEGRGDPAKAAALVQDGDRASATRAWARAEKAYRDALAAYPRSAAAAYGLGKTALAASGAKEQALRYFLQAVALNPGHADASFQGAIVALELKKYPEAALLLHQAAALWPEKDSFFALLINLRSAEGNLAGARAYGEYYLQIAPAGSEQRRRYETWLRKLPAER